MGLQAVKAFIDRSQAFFEAGTASQADIGLYESSGKGFNSIKPIFLSTKFIVNPILGSPVHSIHSLSSR
jgi:hypothetical protein